MKQEEKNSGVLGGEIGEKPMAPAVETEEIEFVGFQPRARAQEWIVGKARSLLKTTDPEAKLQASLVAVKGGFEAILSLSTDGWDLASKTFAADALMAFKNAYKSVRNQYATLKTRYLSEPEPRPFSLY